MQPSRPGFNFHRGLDWALAGFGVVFLTKSISTIGDLLRWNLIPRWSIQSLVDVEEVLISVAEGIVDVLASHVSISNSSFLTGVNVSVPGTVKLFVGMLGLPIHILGVQGGPMLGQALIFAGFWTGTVGPLWYWAGKPLLFWWREY